MRIAFCSANINSYTHKFRTSMRLTFFEWQFNLSIIIIIMRYHRIHILFPAYIHVSSVPFKWQSGVDDECEEIEKVPLNMSPYWILGRHLCLLFIIMMVWQWNKFYHNFIFLVVQLFKGEHDMDNLITAFNYFFLCIKIIKLQKKTS